MKVVSSIKPVSPVHVSQGASINFVYDEKSSNAVWESSDLKKLIIDRDGKAKALEIGQVVVSNTGDVRLESNVFISKVNQIELDK